MCRQHHHGDERYHDQKKCRHVGLGIRHSLPPLCRLRVSRVHVLFPPVLLSSRVREYASQLGLSVSLIRMTFRLYRWYRSILRVGSLPCNVGATVVSGSTSTRNDYTDLCNASEDGYAGPSQSAACPYL